MEKKKEFIESPTMVAARNDCVLVDTLAQGTVTHFGYLMEELENGEEEIILIALVQLFAKEMYWEGLALLTMAFSLREMHTASEMVAAVGTTGNEHCMEMFLATFLKGCGAIIEAIWEEYPSKLN